jgi:Ni,Fe-hydrogenase III component G
MTREQAIEKIRTTLGDKVMAWHEKNPRRYYLEVKPADIPEATRFLFRDMGARFQIASGVDTRRAVEILYHWALDRCNCVVTVRTKLDREHPVIDSVAGICTAAEWIEREMWELLGITFRNHPDMRHLLLKEDWPRGKYPLRRDYVRED